MKKITPNINASRKTLLRQKNKPGHMHCFLQALQGLEEMLRKLLLILQSMYFYILKRLKIMECYLFKLDYKSNPSCDSFSSFPFSLSLIINPSSLLSSLHIFTTPKTPS